MHARRDAGGPDRPAALIVTHYWEPHVGGIERVARHHRLELVARGWNVSAHSTRIPTGAAGLERDASGTVTRHRAVNPFERSISLPVPVPAPGLRRRLTSSAAAADVVVAHGHTYPTSLAAMRAARRADRPFVVVQHNPWVDYPQPLAALERGADRTVGRSVLHAAERVVCVSRTTAEYVESVAPSAQTVVIENGVDTDVFFLDPAASTRRRFTCVRRLVPRNGVDVLIRAWRMAALTDWELVVIGDGPSRRRLEDSSRDLSNVRFRGFVTDRELADTLRSSWASVVPTISGEGFGLVAAESQSCGTPVVAARQGALVEVVRDRRDGLLVDPRSAPSLAKGLTDMAEDPGERQRMAANCRKRDWSWSRVGQRLDHTLAEVVGGRW